MNLPRREVLHIPQDAIPPEVTQALARYMLDRASGFFQLNIRNGQILGFREERIGYLKPR